MAEDRVPVLIPEGTLKGPGQVRYQAFQTSWSELQKLPSRKLVCGPYVPKSSNFQEAQVNIWGRLAKRKEVGSIPGEYS